jgi:hypothetical protein
MEEGSGALDTILLLAGLALIVITTMRVSRRRSGARRPAEGERAATLGILIWLGLIGVALYLIFG